MERRVKEGFGASNLLIARCNVRVVDGLTSILQATAERFHSHVDTVAQIVLAALSAFLHFWRISVPAALVFDEVYFPVFARNYLEGTPFFDAHPPLGKYLIAAGIRFFGFNPLGYRVVDAVFGIGIILLIYRLTTLLFNDRRVGFLAAFLACLDGLLLVESRAGLINIFAVFFSLAAYYLFLKVGENRLQKPRGLYLAGAGICIGAAIAVKWIGAASLGVVSLVYLVCWARRRVSRLRRWLPEGRLLSRIGSVHPAAFLCACVVLPAIVYSATFVIHLKQNPQFSFVELHKQMFGYHAHLREGHRYASPWWSWPVLLRPVSYYWQVDQNAGRVMTVLNIGNPALWWLSLPALLWAFWNACIRRNFALQFSLLAFVAHYVPFALISRATFLYHFLGALPFVIILLAYTLHRLWRAQGLRRELAALAFVVIVLCAIYFFPIWTAVPIPIGAFYQRMWLIGWI